MGRRTYAVVAAAGLSTVAACGLTGPDGSGSRSGPLRFTSGAMSFMMAPVEGPAFFTLQPCLERGSAAQVELVDVAAVRVDGADAVEFEVAWPGPDDELKVGAGPVRQMSPLYGEPTGRGTVQPCSAKLGTTGLDLATVLPAATTRAVVVEGLDVTYEVDGTRHVGRVDVTFGICAARPAEPGDEPADCR